MRSRSWIASLSMVPILWMPPDSGKHDFSPTALRHPDCIPSTTACLSEDAALC